MAKVTRKSIANSPWIDIAIAKARRNRVTQDNRLEFLASLAIEENQVSELQRLIASNCDTIAASADLTSRLLVSAIVHNRIEVVRILLDHGADANTPVEMPPHGKRPTYVALHYAAERGREEIFQLLRVQTKRKHYASADQLLEIGKLPREAIVEMHKLRLAASRGSMQTIHRMIQSGCNVNQVITADRLLPIHTAAMDNQLLATEVLLAAGAKPNAQTEFGFTPLFFCTELPLIKLLVAAGGDVRQKSEYDETLMMRAIRLEVFLFLKEHKLSLRAKDKRGIGVLPNLLRYAVHKKSFGNNKLFKSLEFDKGLATIVRTLVDEGRADTNQKCVSGEPPIVLAAKLGAFLTCEQLLKSGADPHATDGAEKSALDYCAKTSPLRKLFKPT